MLAKAAQQAGYAPLVIDAYGDSDTRRAAHEYRRLCYSGAGIDWLALRSDLSELERRYGRVPICWGSGWEHSGHLLAALSYRYPIIGSSPEALLALANPNWPQSIDAHSFVAAAFEFPPSNQGHLIKDRMRAGGHSVRFSTDDKFLPARCFAQQYLVGASLSVVCLATGKRLEFIGWNEHFLLQKNPMFPFRHSAAIGIPAPCKDDLLFNAIAIAAKKLRLRGLFGVDLILSKDGEPRIVDLNPRPTATVPLHLALAGAFKLHVEPQTQLNSRCRPTLARRRGIAVVYADIPITLPKKLNWPPWVSDVPYQHCAFRNGEPVCTIQAEADTVNEVKRILEARLDELLAMFQTK